ncbi:MAG: putative inner membrane protein [Microgenomates bacterium OLB22]|nr:MAG: putative inner membrane protein [Microgenomates bacterium OLB22]
MVSESKPVNRRLFFFSVLILTGLAAFRVVQVIWPLVALSGAYAIVIYPLFSYLRRKGIPEALASTLALLFSFITLFLPLYFVGNHLINELLKLRDTVTVSIVNGSLDLDTVVDRINEVLSMIPGVQASITRAELVQEIQTFLRPLTTSLLNNLVQSGKLITDTIVFIILVFLITPALPRLRKYLEQMSPLDNAVDETYINRATAMMTSVLRGNVLIAFIQGVLGGIAIWIAGMHFVLTLTLVMIVASLIPLLGTGFITIPISIILFISGKYTEGLIVLLAQIFVISTIDNIIRPYLMSKKATLHPALLLISFFGGIQLFGPLGIIYGPVIMILFVTSLEIYKEHYAKS